MLEAKKIHENWMRWDADSSMEFEWRTPQETAPEDSLTGTRCAVALKLRQVLDCANLLALFSFVLRLQPQRIGAVQNAGGLWLLGTVILLAPSSLRAAVSWTNSGPGVFFVATNGNDQWSGSHPTANLARTDGPFATVTQALQVARNYRKQVGGTSNAPVGIFLRSGLYTLTQPLVLKPEDSNLVLAAYGNETPVLSGGRRITGWHSVAVQGKGVWAAELPEVRQGKWAFHELWVNNRRALLARYPTRGYLRIAQVPDQTTNGYQGVRRFKYKPGDLKVWPTITNAEVTVMNLWIDSHLPISSIDEFNEFINCTKKSNVGLKPGNLYYLEGAFDFINQPGEWCLDPTAGVLYYSPRAGETLQNLEAIAPALTQVLRLEGRPETGEIIERVRLSHLTFSHNEWYFPIGPKAAKAVAGPGPVPAPDPQIGGLGTGSYELPAAVWGQGMARCFIRDCAFTHVGTYALELEEACVSNLVSRCEFSDLGAGGIKLGGKVIPRKAEQVTYDNEISDCSVHDGGQLFHDGEAILLFQTPNNRLLHNLVYNFSHCGICVGWTWGYWPSLATNNLVAFNHIHHVGGRTDGDGPILSDLGGVYTLGRQPGTKILNNLIHDIAGLDYGGWGIYFDEGSSSILAESNIVYRTTQGGLFLHYGATNAVLNNIFAFGRDYQVERMRSEDHLSLLLMHNIVYFDSGRVVGGNWPAHQYQVDFNYYFDARPGAKPEDLRFVNSPLQSWQAMGNDQHSLFTDPLFIAPRQYDFRLWSSSPALKMGFHPIDVSTVGIRPK
jgi:parallel beta-helix repeat protein